MTASTTDRTACADVDSGRAIAGFRVGILTLSTRHLLVPGNVQHAGTFRSPVIYEVVRGVSMSALMKGDAVATPAIVEGARRLEAAGVDVVMGACGSFAHYQIEVAAALAVPVFMSILLEVPLILRALPPGRRLGIVFARVESFTDLVRRQCGIESADRIVALGASQLPAFAPILEQSGELDSAALERQLTELTVQTVQADPTIGAWLLQCSDLPPYAHAIQRGTRLPVFDMATLIEHLFDATRRVSYSG